MRFSGIGYLIKQGWKNMGQNRLMTLASVGVLTACLIITGIASLLSINVNRIVDYFGNQNEIVVYLQEDMGEEAVQALGNDLRALPNVAEVTFTDKSAAFDRMQVLLEDYASLLTGLENVFPASYEVTVVDLELLEQTNAQIRTIAGVDDTYAPSEVADIMITIKTAVNYGGWGLVVILAVVSIIVISNTIRITVFARRKEISIMKYVGATNSFIRMPFFVEGMTVGAIAGVLATGVVCGAYQLVYNYVSDYSLLVANIVASMLKLADIWPVILVSFVVFGIFIGGMGSATSIRKHLKV